MSLFGSEKLFNMHDRTEILRALASRKDWDHIRAEVLRALVDGAGGDVIRISRFVFVSEYFDCVRNNYVELAKIWEDPRLALSAFGATLVGLAGDIIQHMSDMPEGSGRLTQATSLVEMAFHSALLMDQYMFSAYRGLASFYLATGKKDLAAKVCRQYDAAEQELLKSSDEYARLYRDTKYKPVATTLRAEMSRLKAELGIGPV